MTKHLPYGKEYSEMVLSDTKNNIIASIPASYERYCTLDSLLGVAGGAEGIEELDITSPHPHSVYYGETFYYYTRQVPIADWRIMTASNEKTIYNDANHVRWIVFITSGIGMLLLLLCCLVIFRQMRTDFRQKAAVETELKMAAQVQMSMLKPPSFTSNLSALNLNAFMQPTKEAGGDLYDYV